MLLLSIHVSDETIKEAYTKVTFPSYGLPVWLPSQSCRALTTVHLCSFLPKHAKMSLATIVRSKNTANLLRSAQGNASGRSKLGRSKSAHSACSSASRSIARLYSTSKDDFSSQSSGGTSDQEHFGTFCPCESDLTPSFMKSCLARSDTLFLGKTRIITMKRCWSMKLGEYLMCVMDAASVIRSVIRSLACLI